MMRKAGWPPLIGNNPATDCDKITLKKYQNFSVNDFAMDDYFQSWIFRPDENINAFWKSWIENHPEKATEIEEAKDILNNFALPQYALTQEHVSELWKGIQSNSFESKTNVSMQSKRASWYWTAAAVVLIGLTIFLWLSGSDKLEYATQFGETKSIVLPDGSTVILNANSQLSFDKNWEESSAREIWLNGEAYFSVIHKEDHQPFKVTTNGGIAVEVLGTTFNVYHRSVETKVVLNSGQITLSFPVDNKEKKILMKPGELIEYKEDTYKKSLVDPNVYAAWTEKKIILDQTSLQEMIRMAEDNYGVKVSVESEKMLKQTVSGSMPIGNAESFVSQVAMAFQLKVVRKKNSYLLTE
jgi:transmembrane sensor